MGGTVMWPRGLVAGSAGGALVASLLAVAPLRGNAVAAGASAQATTRGDGATLVYGTTGDLSAQNPAFSPDGATMVFTRYLHGYDAGLAPGGGVVKTPAAGGLALPLYNTDDATNVNGLAAWNAATSRIAFAVSSGNGDIATVRADGTGLQRVTNASGNHAYLEPTWAPNGQTLVFQDDQATATDLANHASVDLVAPNGTGLRTLLDGPATGTDNRLPVWSPDGAHILFQRRTNMASTAYDLFTIRPDGTGLTAITHGDNCDSDASWTPDGQWVLDSACFGALAHPNIFMVAVDGSQVIRVTTDATHQDGAPAMSPDKRWVYFESHHTSDDQSPTQIWRIPAPDGSSQLYRATQPAYSAQNPCYVPNSSQLLFTVFTNGYNNDGGAGSGGLFTIPAAGGGSRTVVFHQGNSAVNMPGGCYRAAAGRIAYASDLVNTDNVWTATPGALNQSEHQVTCFRAANLHAQEPTWSPDGKLLVFELADDNNANRSTIWTVPATNDCAHHPVNPTLLVGSTSPPSDNHEPNWSPDGTRIVFQRQTDFTHGWVNLWTVTPTGVLTRITNDPNIDADASWSPDGRSIVYSTDYQAPPPGLANLFVVSAVAGGTKARLTSQCHYDGAPSWSPDGKWVSYERGIVSTPADTETAIWRTPSWARPAAPFGC